MGLRKFRGCFTTHLLILTLLTQLCSFSGISYALLTNNGVKSFFWRSDGGWLQKTPTRIEFSKTTIEWFKLSLLHRDDLPSDVRNSRKFEELTKAREAINVTAVNATARYLGEIWQVFLGELQKDIRHPDIQVSVTVPVLWPLYARQAMEEALNRAGILNENVVLAPKFLIEPEVAALAFFSNAHYFETNVRNFLNSWSSAYAQHSNRFPNSNPERQS